MTETYLPTPVPFPFSEKSCGILRSPSMAYGMKKEPEDRKMLSRVLPDKCCWFAAQSGHTFCAMHKIPEGIIALSNFVRRNEHFHRGVPISCSTEFQAILARHRCNHDGMVMKQCGNQLQTIVTDKPANQLDSVNENRTVDEYNDRVEVFDRNGKDISTTSNEEPCDTLVRSSMFLEEEDDAVINE